MKPNYNFQKAERDREKAAKKEAKLREKNARKQEGRDTGDKPQSSDPESPSESSGS